MQTDSLGTVHEDAAVPPKLYILVRRDLSPGNQAAQAIHGALAFSVEYPEITIPWHRDSNYLVVLSVPNEATLLALAEKYAGKKHHLVREPDWNDVATALVVEPDNDFNRHTLSAFPLALKGAKV